MELTGKQRAQLRAMANELEPIVHIGKDGIGENLVKQANDALEARELIKCRVLDNSMLTAREACDELSRLTRSEQVQVIGTKFVLYRETHAKPKEKRIWGTRTPPSRRRRSARWISSCSFRRASRRTR